MAKSLIVGSSPGWMTVNDNTTRYFTLANAPLISESIEGNSQITYRARGVSSNLYARVANNTLIDPGAGDESFIRSRKNGANGNQVLTIPPGIIGEFEDATNTDTIAAGDEYNGSVTVPSQAGNKSVSITVCSTVFDTVPNTIVVRHAALNFADMSDGNSYVFALSDDGSTLNTLYANVDFNLNASGVIHNLFVKVSSNGNVFAGTNTVVVIYKNQVATELIIRIPANETVQTVFENLTDHVVVSADDEIELVIDSVNSGAVVIEIISVEWESTNFAFHSLYAFSGGGMTMIGGQTDFLPIGGGGPALVVEPEADNKTEMQIACTVSNLALYVSANTLNSFPGASNGFTIYLRKNGVNTALTLNVPEGVAGFFEDASNSVSFVAGDEANWLLQASGLTGSITLRHIGCRITNTEVAATLHIKGGAIKGGRLM